MPPERTQQSFTAAAALNLPLSSHGPSHAPSLERGKACLVCRNRKVKCDGVKPACGACTKSAIAHGEDPNKIACNFEDEERGEKRKRASGSSKVAALEAKINELERIIEQQQNQPPPSTYSMPNPPPRHPSFPSLQPDLSFSASANAYASTSRTNLDVLLQATGQQMASYPQDIPESGVPDSLGAGIFFAEVPSGDFSSDSMYLDPSNTNSCLESARLPAPFESTPPESPPDALLEIFYPGWHKDLPSPLLVMRLVDVYFSKSHAASGMINQAKFLASMSLPPTHSKFPHVSLLHGMLATASRMVGPTFFAQEDKYWGLEDRDQTVTDYHAARAKVAIDLAIARGQSLFQVAQAIVLICLWSFTAARFVEVWLYTGLATRISTPLGLNHIRAIQSYDDGSSSDRPPHMKPNLLPPTGDEEELYERAATFWLAVVCDRFASASTGWAQSIDDLDITSLLPSPGSSYSTGDLISSPLSPHNPNFLMSHPPHLVHCLQLYIKSVVLLGRVTSFMQRSPSPIGQGVNHPDPRRNPNAQAKAIDLRTTLEYKRLDADAVTFRLSIPREFQSSMHTSSDVRMALIFTVPHVATILLHEPFCTMLDADVSLARCLLSARAVLESVYTMLGTSFEISLLPPFINFTWACVGRTLVRELAIKEAKGVTSGVEQLKTDVQTIIVAMRAYRSPIGESTAIALQTLLNSPERCLPNIDLNSTGLVGALCRSVTSREYAPSDTACSLACESGATRVFSATTSRSTPGMTSADTPSPINLEVDYAALFSHAQMEGMDPNDERFKELLGIGDLDGMIADWSPGAEV